MEAAGYYDRRLGHEELFDLYLDPMEACNRADDAAYADVRADLRAKLDAWMQETQDPFLTGRLPAVPT